MAYNYFEKSPVEAAPTIEKESQNTTLNDGLAGDVVDSFQAGALSGMGGMFDFVGAEGVAKSLYAWSDDQQKTMSESGRESLNKQFITEDANGDMAIGEGMKDIDTWILTMANVAGQFAGTAVPGGAAARAVTKAASLGSKGSKTAGAIGMGATGGAAGTGQGMEQARQEIQNMPDDILADSPMFVGVLKDIHSKKPSLSGAEKWDLAKDEIARRVAQDVRTDPKVLVANFAASAIGDPIIGKALTGARIAKSGALKSALAGTVTEGATESIQAGVQQYGINEALQPIDNRDSMKGVVAAGLNEGIAGGAFGGAAGAIGGIANRRAESFKEKSEQVVKDGYEQMVEAGISPEEAMDKIKSQQYEAAIKKGFNEQEAQEIVSKTVRDQFGIDDGVTNEARQVEQAQTIPEDTETPVFKNDDINYDAPTAARQAGFDQTAKAAGQYGDMLTSPAQQSLRDLEAGNNAPTVDERVKAAAFDKSPTPEDRFSPIKYQHEGELLGPDAQNAQGIDNAPIDGQVVPEQGKLPTTEQTKNREMREQAQADLESQPKGIEQKDIIFGEDGRPQQRAAERVKQAGKDSQNLLPQKDIVFAGNESGVNVAKSGEPFKTKRDALLSKEARAARRAGQKTKAVSFDNGFGWTIKGDDGTKQDSEQAAAEQSPETDTVAQNEQGDQAQPAQQEGEALSLNVDAAPGKDEDDKNIAGEMLDDEWQSFTKESGTKNIPRSEMPQVKAESRGAMVNFMKARDIDSEKDEVPAQSLKPTQQEFSPAKVKKAMEFEGGNRSILVSNDNYVLDGHHQWLAAREKGEPVKVIRLNAPIEQLVPLAKEMPSTETQDSQTVTNEQIEVKNEQNSVIPEQKLENSEQDAVNPEQSAELPPILKTTKRKWLQSQAKEQGLKKGSPGFDVAMAKIEEGYEPAIDKALAESSFETYQEFNSDTPESINRQAYSELRKEFGIDDTFQVEETAVEPESTEQNNGPDMFGDSEPPLFNQDPTAQSNNPEIPDSSTNPKKRKVYGWDRVELSKNYTANELDEWIKELSNDPDNQVKDGIYQLDAKTRKKIDELTWAVYYIQKEQKNEQEQLGGDEKTDRKITSATYERAKKRKEKEAEGFVSGSGIGGIIPTEVNFKQNILAAINEVKNKKRTGKVTETDYQGWIEYLKSNKQGTINSIKEEMKRSPVMRMEYRNITDSSGKDPVSLVADRAYEKVLSTLEDGLSSLSLEAGSKGQSTTSQAPVKQAPIESGLDAYDAMAKSISDGELNSAEQIKNVLNYLADNQDSVKAELNKLNKKQLTRMVNGHVWSDTKKAELVNSAYRDMFSRFMFIGNQSSFVSSSSYKLEDKISDAKKHVESLTDQQVAEYSQEQKAKIDAQKERLDQYLDKLKNPQTLDDYKAKIKAQGQNSLTTEQQAEYDKLIAGETIASKNERPTEKEGLKTGGDVELGEPIEGVHGKTGDKIFNVQVISRLGKDAFKEAANFARSMGGGYYKGNFYFKSIEDAELFSGWVNGEAVDTTANQEAKAAQRQTKTASRLKEMAERVEERANETLNADRKTNTLKRIGESERAISNAEKELQIASILRDIPSSGTVVIKNATQKVQVELLDLLSRSLVNAAPESQVNKDGNSRRTFKDNITNAEKAKHARMPLKSARAARLNELADQMLDKKGFILLGRKMKSLTKGKRDQDYITINDSTIPKFIEFIEKHASQYDMIRDEAARYKRLERMGITNEPTLRTALIEYMELKSKSEKTNTPNKLNKLEQQLKRTMIGNRNAFNDFFPTPENMASEIASMADIQPGMRVLEPSAGNGLLADAAREQGASVDVVEMGGQLRDILSEKGFNIVGSDFLEFTPKADYDRIVMNPPFSNDQDIAHVEHAYKMLKPGGKLVAITSSMAGERSNKANKEFSAWLDSLDAEQQALPEGAFKSSLNPTSVNTKAIVIEKPSDAPAVQVASDIKFSKSKVKQNAKGVNAKQAQTIADDFIESLNGANGIKVRILATTAEAEKMWRMSLDGATVKGAYSEMSNTVYVIAENIDSETDLKQTLAHETIAHGGLDTVIGIEAKQAFIDRIKKTKGRKAFEQYWKDANKDYWDASEDVKAEEIFARFVENEPSKGEVKYWWNALKRFIRKQLDKLGVAYREDDELTAMRDMLESIVKGFKAQREPMVSSQAEMAYSQSDKKFSRTTDNDTRTAKQKLGLEEQAAKTFSDIAKGKVNETIDTLKSSPFWNRLNEGIFDGLSGIKNAEEAAGVTDPNRQGYVSARLASGLADVLHGVFNYGAPQWRDGIVQRKEGTKGLLEVFGMVGDDLNNWLAWMGAHRAEQLKAQGKENNLSDADIAELKALANGKERLFEQTRLEYNKVNSAILDMAQQAGLLSSAQRAGFDEEYYVPFFRDMGETDPEMDDIKRMIVEPHTRKGISGQSAQIKKLKGGTQSTKDLLENIIARQSTLIDASLKNKAMQEVVNNLDGTDYLKSETSEDIASLSQQDLNKLGKVKVMVNGKPQAYVVSDPALLRALIQVNDVGSQSLFNKLGRSAKRFLTAGITLSPDFIFKNFVRDAAQAWMINKDGFTFGSDSIKGLKKAFKEDEAYRDLIFSGAAFQGGYIHGADPEAGAQQMRRALRAKGLTSKEVEGYMATIVTSGATLLEKYRGISDKVENANRLSTYEAAIAAGKSKRQAAYEAKDLMDYSLKGNYKLIGTMIDMLPFFNARLQGMSKLVRAAKASSDDRVLRVLSANLAMKGIYVAGFSLALAWANDDDEEYQQLPDWDKDMNWHIFADGEHIRIPKPFELGIVFGTMPERLFHYGTGTQTDKDLGKAVANAVFNTMALNPIPQMVLPAAEVMINKSFFKQAPIEGMADQNKQAEDRYNAYTSDTAKAIAQQFGVSPKKVEHLVKGYTGTIGGYVLGASDIVARMITGKVAPETPVSRYPVVKAFYQGSGPKTNTKFANDFYEALDAANQAYGSYKRAMELGDTARQQELIEKDGKKLRSKATLAKVQRMVSKLRKVQKAINDNDKLDAAKKRAKLDEIQRKINAIYHKAYVALNLGEW